ncbi:hypothetical protein BZARG_2044 [Bizionia argentinensis JUB59]|uniref:FabZ n=1 Tax=Bizionia argentinensis JUB59 TaxID=1046627 RepID=G2EFB0_9FLAO|nr:hypothetical protein [Bizionia argentinensis]EGV42879.2 hypothetical protein BZARG_2044 [Bizionia argentinensis JUB59]
MTTQTLPITDITHLIPQKTPFVMVDTLVKFSAEQLVSKFKILETNIFVENTVLTEAGLVENMAQSVALHTGYDFYLKNEAPPVGYIGSIKSIKIEKLPKLHEIISTHVTILHEFMGVTMVEIQVFNEAQQEIAKGEMKTVIAS